MTFYNIVECIPGRETKIRSRIINLDQIVSYTLSDRIHEPGALSITLNGYEKPLKTIWQEPDWESFKKLFHEGTFVRVYYLRPYTFTNGETGVYKEILYVNVKFIIDVMEETSEEGEPITVISLAGRKDKIISMDSLEKVWLRFREVPNHAEYEWNEQMGMMEEGMRQLRESKASH